MFRDTSSWIAAIVMFVIDVVIFLPLSCHLLPGYIKPGSRQLIAATLISALTTLGALAILIERNVDPFPFGMIYSGILMLVCVEVWYRENPQLFNGSGGLKGWPLFLFHRPGGAGTMAPVPMASYTRVFGTWHAGGVCLCFFVHVVANDFPLPQKAQISLALSLLWLIWATINQWRCIYGGEQFCQMGIMFHSLTGPGCGLCGYWQLWFWYVNRQNTENNNYTASECLLLGTFASFFVFAVVTLWVTKSTERKAVSSSKYN